MTKQSRGSTHSIDEIRSTVNICPDIGSPLPKKRNIYLRNKKNADFGDSLSQFLFNGIQTS